MVTPLRYPARMGRKRSRTEEQYPRRARLKGGKEVKNESHAHNFSCGPLIGM